LRSRQRAAGRDGVSLPRLPEGERRGEHGGGGGAEAGLPGHRRNAEGLRREGRVRWNGDAVLLRRMRFASLQHARGPDRGGESGIAGRPELAEDRRRALCQLGAALGPYRPQPALLREDAAAAIGGGGDNSVWRYRSIRRDRSINSVRWLANSKTSKTTPQDTGTAFVRLFGPARRPAPERSTPISARPIFLHTSRCMSSPRDALWHFYQIPSSLSNNPQVLRPRNLMRV